jgi:hypothetical protein
MELTIINIRKHKFEISERCSKFLDRLWKNASFQGGGWLLFPWGLSTTPCFCESKAFSEFVTFLSHSENYYLMNALYYFQIYKKFFSCISVQTYLVIIAVTVIMSTRFKNIQAHLGVHLNFYTVLPKICVFCICKLLHVILPAPRSFMWVLRNLCCHGFNYLDCANPFHVLT